MPTPDPITAAALVASSRKWTFAYKAVDPAGVERDLTVESCKVDNNDLADKSKRTCNVTIAKGSPFNQLNELFRPYVSLAGGTTWCLGTFLLSSATGSVLTAAGASSSTFVGYDRLLVLDEDKLTDRLTVAAGTVVTTQVASILTGAGLPSTGVAASALTLPAPLEWEPGTPKLTVVNALLSAIGYRSLFTDELGVPVATPYVDPASAPIVWAYAPDRSSVIVPGVDVTLDLFNVPNRFVAYVSEPDRSPLTSSYVNANPESPTSTVNRGRTISEVVQLQQATGDAPPVDQATLDAKVLQLAQAGSQVYSDVDFSTGMMPFHGTGEVFTLDTGSGPIRYREAKWSLDLKVGGEMSHTLRRVVTI